jgi:hypothetical protein
VQSGGDSVDAARPLVRGCLSVHPAHDGLEELSSVLVQAARTAFDATADQRRGREPEAADQLEGAATVRRDVGRPARPPSMDAIRSGNRRAVEYRTSILYCDASGLFSSTDGVAVRLEVLCGGARVTRLD